MLDKFLFDLAPGWALAFDRNQWILLRRRNSRTERGWKPVRFIGTTKTILLRVLRESGVSMTKPAECELAAMPENFCDWLDSHMDNRREGER